MTGQLSRATSMPCICSRTLCPYLWSPTDRALHGVSWAPRGPGIKVIVVVTVNLPKSLSEQDSKLCFKRNIDAHTQSGRAQSSGRVLLILNVCELMVASWLWQQSLCVTGLGWLAGWVLDVGELKPISCDPPGPGGTKHIGIKRRALCRAILLSQASHFRYTVLPWRSKHWLGSSWTWHFTSRCRNPDEEQD